ncbi:hypothetical protein OG589_31970 [Sphaerisporangium sp. NBC_01403]|uniref:hypothetical protein n=1 Tax=Sphaerisporangium sp. NBC_01403 TaxID=2903599 RepID=UPI003243B067
MRTVGFLGAVDVLAKASSITLARGYVRSLLAGHPDVEEIELLVSELVASLDLSRSSFGRLSGSAGS